MHYVAFSISGLLHYDYAISEEPHFSQILKEMCHITHHLLNKTNMLICSSQVNCILLYFAFAF